MNHQLEEWNQSFRRWVDPKRVIESFRRCASAVPAYIRILREQGIESQNIRSMDDFVTKVPVIDKQMTFSRFLAKNLLANDVDLGGMAVSSSSGFSRSGFSWGISTRTTRERNEAEFDELLTSCIPAGRGHGETVVVNCLPYVEFRPAAPIIVDAGPRVDVALAAMDQFRDYARRVVILGEPHFLKSFVERGTEDGVDWGEPPTFLVTGGEIVPESYRRYLGGLLGQHENDAGQGMILISFGVTELATSLAQESALLRGIRMRLDRDRSSRDRLLGPRAPFLPTFVRFDPNRFLVEFAERDGLPRLVVSTLDLDRALPLIRYDTGDWASLFEPGDLARTDPFNSSLGSALGSLPVVAIWGRGKCFKMGPDEIVYPETIKEAFYRYACEEPTFAKFGTGDFRFVKVRRSLTLHLQMKKGRVLPGSQLQAFTEFLRREYCIDMPVTLDLAGPEDNRRIDLQRKFRYGF